MNQAAESDLENGARRPRLSVVLIVKNEAHCLGDCLSSIKSIADEIVIGDTGSTDNTVEIAKSFGARVINVEWRNDFAYARNCVLNEATGDWLLSLDADEVVDEAGADRIRAIVDNDDDGAQGIWMTMANYSNAPAIWRWVPAAPASPYTRGFLGYIETKIVRLFKNGLGIEYREPVHENLAESLAEIDAVLRDDTIMIHHYGFDADPKHTKQKGAVYFELAQEKVRKMPEHAKAWYDLAAAALQNDDLGMARNAAERSVELDPENSDFAVCLATIYIRGEEYNKASTVLERFVQDGKAPVEFALMLGVLANFEGRFEEAKSWFEATLQADPLNTTVLTNFARTLDQLDDVRGAKALIEEGLVAAPELNLFQPLLVARELRAEGELLFQDGDVLGALKLFVRALEADPQDPILHNNIGVALNTLNNPASAITSFERALKLSPHMAAAKENLEALSLSSSTSLN